MVRLNAAKIVYAAAILAMPLSYGLRDLLGLDITWVNPTLILGFVVFLLLGMPLPDRKVIGIVIYALIAAGLGALLLKPSPDRGKTALYVIFMEPARLTLNIIWYSVSIIWLRRQRDFVLRWLAYGVMVQMGIAFYLYCALYDLAPVPDILLPFLAIYKYRQAIWFGNVQIYRMAGTFFESPPFSLFMFCCFVVFALALQLLPRRRRHWFLSCGFLLSLVGAIMGFAGQVLLALPVLGFAAFRSVFRNARASYRILAACLSTLLLAGGVLFVGQKLSASGRGQPIYGSSVAERSFHSAYGLALFAEQPISLVFGIGPGRYGDYAVRTGIFPSSVTLQVTPVEWLVEYGCLGCVVLGSWLWNIGKRSFLAYRSLGVSAFASLLVAVMFQASWKWESWFFALAFLYVSCNDTQDFSEPYGSPA